MTKLHPTRRLELYPLSNIGLKQKDNYLPVVLTAKVTSVSHQHERPAAELQGQATQMQFWINGSSRTSHLSTKQSSIQITQEKGLLKNKVLPSFFSTTVKTKHFAMPLRYRHLLFQKKKKKKGKPSHPADPQERDGIWTTVFCSFWIKLLERNIVEHHHLNKTKDWPFRREHKPNTRSTGLTLTFSCMYKNSVSRLSSAKKGNFYFLQISVVGFFFQFTVLQRLFRFWPPSPMERESFLQGMIQKELPQTVLCPPPSPCSPQLNNLRGINFSRLKSVL